MGRVQARDRWIVEHLGEPIGMIVRDEAGFVFHAAAKEVWSLDRHVFPTMHVAERAARQAAVRSKSPTWVEAPDEG